MNKRILILANHYNTLRIFRKDLLKKLCDLKYEVYIVMPNGGEEHNNEIKSFGCNVINLELDRRGMNPFKDLKLLKAYKEIIKEINPSKVLTFTIKCNIYGAIGARKAKIPCYSFVTGLGSMMETGGIKRKIAIILYKLAFKKVEKVFFENKGNLNFFVCNKIVKKEKTVCMPGAGVNLEDFAFCDYPQDKGIIEFLFVGRIMKEKGIDELLSAIKNIKQTFSNVLFSFIGWLEEDYREIIDKYVEKDLIRYYGFQENVIPFLKESHCVILPSYHEGMSNTLLESASVGRPLITSNIYGCKEAVVEGVNGFLCEVKSAISLQEQILKFINLSYEGKLQMGIASRKHVEKFFDKRMVVDNTIKEILGD